MLRIGEFSMLTRISIHMLRHYDEIGLLVPHFVDVNSGYRYYLEDQLPVANAVRALKEMGFSLEKIKSVFEADSDNVKIREKLKTCIDEKKKEIEQGEKQLLLLENTLKSMVDGSPLLNNVVTVKEIPERMVVSYRQIIPSYAHEGTLWNALDEQIASQKIKYSRPSFNIAVFYEKELGEEGVDVEVQRGIVEVHQETEKLSFRVIKPVLAATLTYKGKYDWLAEANIRIENWIRENHFERSGPIFNIYHVSPETETDPKNMITEVCFPIS